MADRADWDAATRAQRQLTVAADAELRRRHPDQHYPPLRSAEPQPATPAHHDQLTAAPRWAAMSELILASANAHTTALTDALSAAKADIRLEGADA